MEAGREVSEPRTINNDATATAPLIVNGLTVRPREKVNVWRYGILFLPDFALLLVIAVSACVGCCDISTLEKNRPLTEGNRGDLAIKKLGQ